MGTGAGRAGRAVSEGFRPQDGNPAIWRPLHAGEDGMDATVRKSASIHLPRSIPGTRLLEVSPEIDPFDRRVADDLRDRIWGTMLACQEHRFLVTTAHTDRMAAYLEAGPRRFWRDYAADVPANAFRGIPAGGDDGIGDGALPGNIWLGARVSNTADLRARAPALLGLEAPVRVLKAVPLTGNLCVPTGYSTVSLETFATSPCDMDGARAMHPHWRHEQGSYNMLAGTWWAAVGDPDFESSSVEEELPRIHWILAGGSSGPDSEPVHPDWVRGLRDLCAGYGIPFLFQGWGDWTWDEEATFEEAARVAGGRDHVHYSCGRTAIRSAPGPREGPEKPFGAGLDGEEHAGLPSADADFRDTERPAMALGVRDRVHRPEEPEL